MKIHIPGIDLRIEISGMSAGIVCIVIGALLVIMAANVLTSGGVPSAASNGFSLSTTVLAQEPTSQVASQTTGWAYLGHEGGVDDWAFETLVADPTSQFEIMQTKQRVTVHRDHYKDLTGSFIGMLLGYEKPAEAGAVNPGTCVRVTNREVVGFGKVWLEIETLPSCEPVQ